MPRYEKVREKEVETVEKDGTKFAELFKETATNFAGPFYRLSALRGAWVRVTFKNIRVDHVSLERPTFLYIG